MTLGSDPEPGRALWTDALRIAALAGADPHGCGGIWLKAGPGPVRDAFLAALQAALPPGAPSRRMPTAIADDRLLGGLDLTATLAAGRPVVQRGLMAEADRGLVVVPMAERLGAGTAARLAAALDTGAVAVAREGLATQLPARFGLILLDEAVEDEAAPRALTDRLAFHLDLSRLASRDLAPRDLAPRDLSPPVPAPAATELQRPTPPASAEAAATALCAAAEALGIGSIRAPILALRVARLAAGLSGDPLGEAQVSEAARLVLAPRATRLPPGEEAPETGPEAVPGDPRPGDLPETQETGDPETDRTDESGRALEEVVLEAARAAIPVGLLAFLAGEQTRSRSAQAGRAGAVAASTRAGRPAGSRPGDPRRGRLALVETLRAAAPWQRLRGGGVNDVGPARIRVRPEDVRIARYRQRTETTTIFAVDASGSAALERLAEAKGAVELLLAESYVRRDRVALVAFRGRGADLVLAPTRSLVRAKRGLAGLPGGGGTPLAAGLDAALDIAEAVRRGGGTPVVVLLTDGRANIARSGEAGRARAGEDALAAARAFRAAGQRAILIDTAPRPQEAARRLAAAMAARYLPLPQADAGTLSVAVRDAGRAA
ncbi:magnesium chelatase subunit D [Methylobacterium soli]|uniref:Magnesium chelatase subunit D n=1 Tax=Methylobacterium soli TaxID=553447 RepID=A0A6L3T4G7_9HYPH|nr:magnesium chelatase subunit D [Methylobacterium soli]KAB1080073.1 magnesium chelatase subunit D [Methylobacterium soli]GJE44030.1 Magnesium-chelatase 60 kDa subunit [Methylobacterium soli]